MRRCSIAIGTVAAVLSSLVSASAAADVPPLAGADDASLLAAPEAVARALRSNVMIDVRLAGGRRSIASGVVLVLRDGVAYIATGRHVVDIGFVGRPGPEASTPDDLTVVGEDGVRAPAKIEWLAPHGIDLAIVSASLSHRAVRAARWDRTAPPRAGDSVFAVGNPGGAGWRHTSGSIMQVRDQEKDGHAFQMLQAKIALAPGYSGGGLYDAAGFLIGINSLGGVPVGDHRVSGGIGLATALPTLLDLAPARLALP